VHGFWHGNDSWSDGETASFSDQVPPAVLEQAESGPELSQERLSLRFHHEQAPGLLDMTLSILAERPAKQQVCPLQR
jgi:hypothetical protein